MKFSMSELTEEQMLELASQQANKSISLLTKQYPDDEIKQAVAVALEVINTSIEDVELIICDSPMAIVNKMPDIQNNSNKEAKLPREKALVIKYRHITENMYEVQKAAEEKEPLMNKLKYMLSSKLSDGINRDIHSNIKFQILAELYYEEDTCFTGDLFHLYQEIVRGDEPLIPSISYSNIEGIGCYELFKHLGLEYDQKEYDRVVNYNRKIFSCNVWGDTILVSRNPIEINSKGNKLHKDGGMSVRFADNWGLWHLNNVNVPRWLAEQNEHDIDPAKFSKLKNAEIRREFIYKVGIERIVKSMGAKSLDKQGDYELLLVDLKGTTGEWPYLKMLNPSIGTWHMECVPQNIKTVRQALNWRNRSELIPEQLT